MTELSLEDNLFISIPTNAGEYLESVESLNINGADFYSFEEMVDSLTTLRNLKSLILTLNEEIEVDYVMMKLPYLEFLNGLPVERVPT